MDHIAALTSKLNKAYAIRSIKPFLSVDILRMIYFYVHSVVSYGIILGGNSHHSNNIFKIQKRIIRIITNTGSLNSWHQLFQHKYFHFHLNTFPNYLFFLTRIEFYFKPILKSMI